MKTHFGQTMYDAITPSNLEVLFEFLGYYNEVPLSDGHSYRIQGTQLQRKFELDWRNYDVSVTYFAELVKDYTSDDWANIKSHATKLSTIDFSNPNLPSFD